MQQKRPLAAGLAATALMTAAAVAQTSPAPAPNQPAQGGGGGAGAAGQLLMQMPPDMIRGTNRVLMHGLPAEALVEAAARAKGEAR